MSKHQVQWGAMQDELTIIAQNLDRERKALASLRSLLVHYQKAEARTTPEKQRQSRRRGL